VSRKARRKRRSNLPASSAIEHTDDLDQCCAQAIAIGSLLMEADTDSAIQDTAWAILCLVERARSNGESLLKFTREPTRVVV